MDGNDERRRVWPEEIREWLRGAWWALLGGWALGAGYHGAPIVLMDGPAGGRKGRQIGPTVRPEEVRDLMPGAFDLGKSRGEVRTVVIASPWRGKGQQQVVREIEELRFVRRLWRRRLLRRVGIAVASLAVLVALMRRR